MGHNLKPLPLWTRAPTTIKFVGVSKVGAAMQWGLPFRLFYYIWLPFNLILDEGAELFYLILLQLNQILGEGTKL